MSQPTLPDPIFSDYREDGDFSYVSINYPTPELPNLLRRAIFNEIETYAAGYATFYYNSTYRDSDVLALRFGQLVIDNDIFTNNWTIDRNNYETFFEISGPQPGNPPIGFSSNDIPNIPWAAETPILDLYSADQILRVRLVIKKGTGKDHVKWRPVSVCVIKDQGDHFDLVFERIGMMSGLNIINKAWNARFQAGAAVPSNIFFQPLVPDDMMAGVIEARKRLEKGEKSPISSTRGVVETQNNVGQGLNQAETGIDGMVTNVEEGFDDDDDDGFGGNDGNIFMNEEAGDGDTRDQRLHVRVGEDI